MGSKQFINGWAVDKTALTVQKCYTHITLVKLKFMINDLILILSSEDKTHYFKNWWFVQNLNVRTSVDWYVMT